MARPSFLSGLLGAIVLALGTAVCAAQEQREINVVVDDGVLEPYFSMRCYAAAHLGAIGPWRRHLSKGEHYRCAGRGEAAPAFARIQLQTISFAPTGAPIYLHSCDAARTCARLVAHGAGHRFQVRCDRREC